MSATNPPRSRGQPPPVWQFYIVTKVDGLRRPLAIVQTRFLSISHIGTRAVFPCWSLMNILTDPANRLALEAERALSIDFYHNASGPGMLDSEIHPFPFAVTCLWLGVCSDRCPFSYEARHLDAVYTAGHNPAVGMIVFDVTDLDDLQYGIVSFEVDPTNQASPSTHIVEIGQQRSAFSAMEFLSSYNLSDCIENARELDRLSVINEVIIDLTRPQTTSTSTPRIGKSLRDQAITTLIDSTIHIENFDVSIFDGPRRIPDFKDLLYRCLQVRSEYLGSSRSAGQLVGLAFEGETHLDLVRFKGISPEVIGFALQMEELRNVDTISLCTDTIQGTTIDILDALSHSSSLRNLYFFQGPNRESDEGNIDFFKVLSRRPHMLQRGKVLFTNAFSVALNRELWLGHGLLTTCHPPAEIFPVHHVLLRSPSDYHNSNSYLTRFYMGHALLKPEAFAAGFLRWMRKDVVPFSIGSSFIGHPPGTAEVRPVLTWTESQEYVPGSWIVLVSREKCKVTARGFAEGMWVEYVKYAFAHLLVDVEHSRPSRRHPYNMKPEHLEVTNLREFLEITAPATDLAAVDRSLAETAECISKGLNQEYLPDPGQWLTAMGQDEACELMNYFLNSPPSQRSRGYRWQEVGTLHLPGVYM